RRRSSAGSDRRSHSRTKVAKSGRRWVRPERMVSRQSVRFAAGAATSQARAKRAQRAATARPARSDMGGSVARGARGRQGGRVLSRGGMTAMAGASPRGAAPREETVASVGVGARGSGGRRPGAPVKHFPRVSRTPRRRRGACTGRAPGVAPQPRTPARDGAAPARTLPVRRAFPPHREGNGMRVLRIVGWVVGAIILLIVAAGVAVWAAPGPIGRWAVAYPVSAMIGRQMRVAGPLSIHWGSPIRIVAEKVSLANASWGMAPQMFAAKRVVLVFYPWSLIRGPTRIVLVEADDASLLLETSKTGEKNWAFSNAAPKHRESFPVLQQLVLKQSQLTWHNGETDATTVIGADALSLDAPDPQGPVK